MQLRFFFVSKVPTETLLWSIMVPNQNASTTQTKCGKKWTASKSGNGNIGALDVTSTFARPADFTSRCWITPSLASTPTRTSRSASWPILGYIRGQSSAHPVRKFAGLNLQGRAVNADLAWCHPRPTCTIMTRWLATALLAISWGSLAPSCWPYSYNTCDTSLHYAWMNVSCCLDSKLISFSWLQELLLRRRRRPQEATWHHLTTTYYTPRSSHYLKSKVKIPSVWNTMFNLLSRSKCAKTFCVLPNKQKLITLHHHCLLVATLLKYWTNKKNLRLPLPPLLIEICVKTTPKSPIIFVCSDS